MDIVVVGSVALDTIETPWGNAEDALGGSATYFSVAAAYHCPVRLVAVVGEDLPSSARDLFAERKIDVSGLEVAEGKCFRWGGRYHNDVNRRDTLFTHLNVFEHFHPKLADSHRGSNIVFLANIHPGLQLEVLEQVESPKLVAVDTMNLWIDIAKGELEQVLSKADLVFLNDEETRQFSGESNLPAAVSKIQRLGPSKVVVKKGEHGALLFDGDRRFALAAFLLDKVHDPTGAGDCFAGGFLGHLAKEERFDHDAMREAMIQGTILASFATEDFSVDRFKELNSAEIDARRAALSDLTSWPEQG